MIICSSQDNNLYACMDTIGLKKRIDSEGSVLIKINMARPSEPSHPRTDVKLLSDVIKYIYMNNGFCAIAESSNGYLRKNLENAGFDDIIDMYNIKIIDLDLEEVEKVVING